MKDLNARIKQLTNLILTSQTVDENRGDESRPASPSKIDFDMTPYQVRYPLLSHEHEVTYTDKRSASTRTSFRAARDRIASVTNPCARSGAPGTA
jgi:hypothetical protein